MKRQSGMLDEKHRHLQESEIPALTGGAAISCSGAFRLQIFW